MRRAYLEQLSLQAISAFRLPANFAQLTLLFNLKFVRPAYVFFEAYGSRSGVTGATASVGRTGPRSFSMYDVFQDFHFSTTTTHLMRISQPTRCAPSLWSPGSGT